MHTPEERTAQPVQVRPPELDELELLELELPLELEEPELLLEPEELAPQELPAPWMFNCSLVR